jgi:hypothetical protein
MAPNGDGKYATGNTYDYSGLYSKALLQDNPGIVNLPAFTSFVKDIQRAVPRTPANHPPGAPYLFEPVDAITHKPIPILGGTTKLNGPQGAWAYQPVGIQSNAGATVPPPAVSSTEYAVELIELYWASLLRDLPFTAYDMTNPTVKAAVMELNKYVGTGQYRGPAANGQVTPALLFRGGGTPFGHPAGNYFGGEDAGPYISQFCIWPTSFGAQQIDQKMQTYLPGQDYMTDLNEWSRVQKGLPPAKQIAVDPVRRYMNNGRALAAFTHQDELYQAYFIAYLVMKTWGVPLNPDIPYSSYANQQPFGTFGGPDIAATLAAVAKAALNAVWYQKWSIHLRHRPESGGGLVHLNKTAATPLPAAASVLDPAILTSDALAASVDRFSRPGGGSGRQRYLLSQAFPEGSPPHPAYPTGHGTVAGACITALKFFFDCDIKVASLVQPMVPSEDGMSLKPYSGADANNMTVNGELHKLAHNISFGHGIHAGIHWRSDTDESMLLGEQVALAFLKQQSTFYEEAFAGIKITTMDGNTPPPFTNT